LALASVGRKAEALALLRARVGRLDEARRLLDDALRLRPDYPQAQVLKGQLEGRR
jgi:hypothetical protein